MHNTGFWNQYKVLQRRAFQAYTRNPLNVAGRTLMAIFIGLIGGWVFMKDAEGEQCTVLGKLISHITDRHMPAWAMRLKVDFHFDCHPG